MASLTKALGRASQLLRAFLFFASRLEEKGHLVIRTPMKMVKITHAVLKADEEEPS